ncbi:molybdopterin molybdotransferase [Ferrithrix thermotolerans DSM 19514]|uniref:Molybdopterin molybdotransferase n=1 Tax=Ferrithrix thermotolerans DSM 19514 TaxID=1121881 RepID=A0A1M4T2K8_9ACTN|nr:hypothetical protein [Ferrithrix thermotolerans]SHE38669.1 molybdopterin molybdotransferase [Ferrithrix thermotolerans DSM 19514]
MFETIMVVDYSASSRPKTGKDTIWLGVIRAPFEGVELYNPPTRFRLSEIIKAVVKDSVDDQHRALLALDFAISYPASFIETFYRCTRGLATHEDSNPFSVNLLPTEIVHLYLYLERSVVDDSKNRNNRFDVASELNRAIGQRVFWGHPTRHSSQPWLYAHKDKRSLELIGEYRNCDQGARTISGRRFISSPFQLYGAGSVGSQSILGIARLMRLARELQDQGVAIDLWPYPMQSIAPAPLTLCEWWPSMIQLPDVYNGPKDRQQVICSCKYLSKLQDSGELTQLLNDRILDKDNPSYLEGAILGVPFK